MAQDDSWLNEFYLEEDGTSPVEEYLDQLDVKTRARFGWSMERLRLENIRAHEPLVRHLAGDLWELREESNTNIYRIIYFFFSGRRIVFVHGFQKKTQKTPARELAVARTRAVAFHAREQQHTEGMR